MKIYIACKKYSFESREEDCKFELIDAYTTRELAIEAISEDIKSFVEDNDIGDEEAEQIDGNWTFEEGNDYCEWDIEERKLRSK